MLGYGAGVGGLQRSGGRFVEVWGGGDKRSAEVWGGLHEAR